MDAPYFIRPGEGERIRQRVGPGRFLSVPLNVEHGFCPCGSSFRLLNFHTPHVGFIGWLRNPPE